MLCLGNASVVGVLLLIASGSKKAPPVGEDVEPAGEGTIEEEVAEVEPAEEGTLEEKEAPIAEIGERRRICMEILDRIQEAIPLFVWLTSITTTSAHEVFIQGIAFSRTRIQEFAQRLGAEEKPLIRKDRFEGKTVSKFSLAGRLPQRPTQAQPPAFISPDARKQTIEAILRKGKPLNPLTCGAAPSRDCHSCSIIHHFALSSVSWNLPVCLSRASMYVRAAAWL